MSHCKAVIRGEGKANPYWCGRAALARTGFCLRHLKARLTAIEREQAARALEYRRLLDAYSMSKKPGTPRWGKK